MGLQSVSVSSRRASRNTLVPEDAHTRTATLHVLHPGRSRPWLQRSRREHHEVIQRALPYAQRSSNRRDGHCVAPGGTAQIERDNRQ